MGRYMGNVVHVLVICTGNVGFVGVLGVVCPKRVLACGSKEYLFLCSLALLTR